MNHPFSRLAATMSQCLTVDCRAARKRASRSCARDVRPWKIVFDGGWLQGPFAADPQRDPRRRNLQNGCRRREIHVVFTKPVNELLSAAGERERERRAEFDNATTLGANGDSSFSAFTVCKFAKWH